VFLTAKSTIPANACLKMQMGKAPRMVHVKLQQTELFSNRHSLNANACVFARELIVFCVGE
jgi:hypothetical protein